MLRKLAGIILITFCFLFLDSHVGLADSNACVTSSYLLVHINGINTSHEEALKNAVVLASVVGDNYAGEKIDVILAENKTNKFWSDVKDVFTQKLNEYPNVSSELIFKALVNGMVSSLLPEDLKRFVTGYNVDKIKDSGLVSYSDDDLKDIVGAIRAKMSENRKILLVPHSQGNLYANAAYTMLTTGDNAVPTSAIKIVGIASPAAYVAGNGDYITSSNDLVISGLRALNFSVLDSNFTIGYSSDDVLGHNFADIYLNENHEGCSEVIRKIHAAMDLLVFPGGDASQGPITVTLTWGSQLDVDLHVFEPNGAHVYYLNKSGVVGILDLDDTSGYGPEHYYTDCGNLQTGTYRIGVNYFSGIYPEVATVTISTPVNIITRSVRLEQVLGINGNSNPIEVGSVVVSRTSTGRYTYTIN